MIIKIYILIGNYYGWSQWSDGLVQQLFIEKLIIFLSNNIVIINILRHPNECMYMLVCVTLSDFTGWLTNGFILITTWTKWTKIVPNEMDRTAPSVHSFIGQLEQSCNSTWGSIPLSKNFKGTCMTMHWEKREKEWGNSESFILIANLILGLTLYRNVNGQCIRCCLEPYESTRYLNEINDELDN